MSHDMWRLTAAYEAYSLYMKRIVMQHNESIAYFYADKELRSFQADDERSL
jgi:hypothetical protein